MSVTVNLHPDTAHTVVTTAWPEQRNEVPNPTFNAATTGWTPNRGTLSLTSASSPVFGTKQRGSYVVTSTGGATSVTGPSIAYTPGTQVSATVRIAHTRSGITERFRVGIGFYDGTGTLLTTTYGAYVGVANDVVANAVVQAASHASAATIRLEVVGADASDNPLPITDGTFQFDNAILSFTATAWSYFDGDTPGYRWTGTAHNSVSELIRPSQVNVRRQHWDGSTYPVRNAEPATAVLGGWSGEDHEAPLDESFWYVASSPETPVSYTSDETVLPSNGKTWLKHPGIPALNTVITPTQAPSWSTPVPQGIFDVLGRRPPIAITMRRQSERGDLSVFTATSDERVALGALLSDGIPLLLSTPSNYGLGNLYLAIGEVSEDRIGIVSDPSRLWTLPFTVVDRPVGSALAVHNTWSEALGAFPSWADLNSQRGSWTGLLIGQYTAPTVPGPGDPLPPPRGG